MDREHMNEVVVSMREVLRLDDWYVELQEDADQLHAFVAFEREQRRATIFYNPETITAFHLRHEMVHILLHDYTYLASNGRSTDMMDALNMFEERICNVIAEVADY